MKHGAAEYVQKPFSAEELAEFVSRILVKRQARLESMKQPTVRIVSPSQAETAPAGEYSVPGGSFVAAGHTWVRIEPDGQVRVGVDDFAHKAMGEPGGVDLPAPGTTVRKGEPLFAFRRGKETLAFRSPVSGKVVEDNANLKAEVSLVAHSPYRDGWICRIQPEDLSSELPEFRIGRPVVEWYGEEIRRLRDMEKAREGRELDWQTLESSFLR
jgi:glycine cleavage system H lipoate-binding protein